MLFLLKHSVFIYLQRLLRYLSRGVIYGTSFVYSYNHRYFEVLLLTRCCRNFCRFAEPNGVPPRRSATIEFSPNRDSSPSSRKANSPRYRKQLLHRAVTDSATSDYSDDGFGDNAMLPTVGSSMVSQCFTLQFFMVTGTVWLCSQFT